jgi:hypothetical protein
MLVATETTVNSARRRHAEVLGVQELLAYVHVAEKKGEAA